MMADLGGRQQKGEKSGVEGYCTELEIQEKEIEPVTQHTRPEALAPLELVVGVLTAVIIVK